MLHRALAAVLLLPLLAGVAWADPPSAASELRSKDPDRRENALLALRETPRPDLRRRASGLRPLLLRLLGRDPVPRLRGLAGIVLARVDPAGAGDRLLKALADERAPSTEVLLIEALAALPADRVLAPLTEAARDPAHPRLGCLAAEALGGVADTGATDALLDLLSAAPHWAVAAGACLGLGQRREDRVPPALLSRLRHPDAAVRSAAREALVRLCLVDHGPDPAAWEAWWRGVREDYRLPEPGTPPAVADAGATSEAPRDRPTHSRFFGVPLSGRRVAFVIDFSQSMWGPRRERAEQELVDAVKGLPGDHVFSVVLFNEDVWWFGDGPLPARPAQKFDLAGYLPEQETRSYTNIFDALEQALGLLGTGRAARDPAPGLDDLVLLSDGFPNRGRLRRTGEILEAVGEMNRGRARIHAVSLGDESHDLLPELARQGGGRFVTHPIAK